MCVVRVRIILCDNSIFITFSKIHVINGLLDKAIFACLIGILQRSQRFCPVTVTVTVPFPSPSRHCPVPRRSESSNVLKRS